MGKRNDGYEAQCRHSDLSGRQLYPALTYGQVLPYEPADGVEYGYYTTLKGAMEKEDPNNWEFVIPAKLKQLYQAKDFGRYAMPNGEMPICFIVNTDNTGGNSGSPVFNAKGELIGTGFDRNYEGSQEISPSALHHNVPPV